jgi:CRP/FNR family transcriptional regulator, cyclic AMP receptor protein
MATSEWRHLRASEDALGLLTAKGTEKYLKGQILYSESQPPKHLHLVIDGRVQVLHLAQERRPVLIAMYGPDEFFGECALLDSNQCLEEVSALEHTEVMKWTRSEIEELIASRPQLGFALLQTMTRRAIDFSIRLQSTLCENTGDRILHSLVYFAKRLGSPSVGGSVRMPSLSHKLLARYTGTSREIVSQYMNRFRRQGLLQYSRKEIVLSSAALGRDTVQALGATTSMRLISTARWECYPDECSD